MYHFRGKSAPNLPPVTPGGFYVDSKSTKNVPQGLYLSLKVDKLVSNVILSRSGTTLEPKIPFWGSIRPLFDPGDPPVGRSESQKSLEMFWTTLI